MFYSWVEDSAVADRLLDIWKDLCKIVTYWEARKKPKPPTSASYILLKDATHDLFLPAKLTFFSFIASLLQPYLKSYQTNQPMLPFMYGDLEKMFRNLLELFVQPDELVKCKKVFFSIVNSAISLYG